MKTKLTFLGVGGAFTMENFQSNMLLEVEDVVKSVPNDDGSPDAKTVTKRLLIDAGGDVRFSLKAVGLGAKDIDGLYISHCHADHIGGVEWLGFTRYFSPGPRPDLFISERLATPLWNDSLRGGMASHQGVLLNLDSFFGKVRRIRKNGSFTWGGIKCQIVQTVHYMDGYEIVPSYGLLIKPPGKPEAFLTTDTQFCPRQIEDFYKRAGIIFQDCETYDWKNGKIKSGVHAHYSDLRTLSPEIKAKMWLYHYQDGELPDCKADGFAGFITKGQSFDL
jgi:ribonuclease BN (tRNA processing enzyme)